MNELLAATILFVGGHFLLSSSSLRNPLTQKLGSAGFQGLYAASVLGAFLWMIFAYGKAPIINLWYPAPALSWMPQVLMPIAFFGIVAGLTTPNPTIVGGQKFLSDSPQRAACGIFTITRHPFLWGTSLWAFSHLLTNGDAASIALMTGIATLSLGGMHHIDLRREAELGAAWGPFALTTSLVPFAAIATQRTELDWHGIGWWRPALALGIHLAAMALHPHIIGVSPFPG
ncbi:NnrU family protein [Pelagibius sp. Alg239-R121]|uniref:NnrU family protein n=1 Tax=Pelagibius sp. Alg239-R121 TaxID=2993448 RepID=UPI0024A72F1E|nr:NnrU family protein [Pelagibius sp. Alg239-R121]